jgi:hypothetical protein
MIHGFILYIIDAHKDIKAYREYWDYLYVSPFEVVFPLSIVD